MELSEAIRRRRMVRTYDPDRCVPDQVVDRLLDHAVRAPSAGFTQGWAFLVLRRTEDRARFWAASSDPHRAPGTWLRGLMTAPLLVLCLADKDAYLDRYAEADKGWTDRDEARWPVPYWDVDTGMAALLMLLTAVDEGLGSCFFGVPPAAHDRVRAALDVPVRMRLVGVVSVGYPDPTVADRRSPSLCRGRRPVTEVGHEGRWGSAYRPAGPPA